jgi:hypothetical protein
MFRVALLFAVTSYLWAPLRAAEAAVKEEPAKAPESKPQEPLNTPRSTSDGNTNLDSQFPVYGYPYGYGYGMGYPGFGMGYPGYGYGMGYPGFGMGYPGYGYAYGAYTPYDMYGYNAYYGSPFNWYQGFGTPYLGYEGWGMPYSYPALPWYGYASQTPALGLWITQPPLVPNNPQNVSAPTGFIDKSYPYGSYQEPYAYPFGYPAYKQLTTAIHKMTLGVQAAMPVNLANMEVATNAFTTYVNSKDPSVMPEALLAADGTQDGDLHIPAFGGFGAPQQGAMYNLAP